MRRTRIKICGFTNPEDTAVAVALGVDAIGLNFCDASPRYIDIKMAKEILKVVPAFVTSVGLFMDASQDQVERITQQVPLDVLQFHGNESSAYANGFKHPYIKAIGMQDQSDLLEKLGSYENCSGFLLDSHATGAAGGTGQTFDWDIIPTQLRDQIILAGGINPDNVAECITQVKPYAVDVSSGVESAPGKKDQGKMQQFIQEVKRADG